MAQNNPFNFDIDDDGLPKYSPDRKNITAYHMYKLGMTDSLPDPDVPEPLFRTPSYVKEMEEREREREREMNRLAQQSKRAPSPFSGEDGVTNPMERTPQQTKPADPLKPVEFKPVELKPLALDTGKDKLPFSSVTLDAAVVRNEPKPAQPGHSAGTVSSSSSSPFGEENHSGQPENALPSGPLKEVLDKLTDGYMKLHFGDGFSNPPESGPGIVSDDRIYPARPVGPVNGVCVPERMPDGSAQTGPFTMNAGQMADRVNGEWIDKGLLENSGENPDAGIRGPSGDLPLRRLLDECLDAMQEGRSDKRLLFFREASQTDGTPGAAIRKIPSADGEVVTNHAFDTGPDLSGWMERETAQADRAGVQQDGGFSVNELEAPSAGRERSANTFQSVHKADNPANPGFAPLQVAVLGPRQFPIPSGRREVSVELTNDMNSGLTRLNHGYAIGINFTAVSRFEGGSHPVPNIPISKKELDEERRLIEQDRRNGTNVARTRKWANNSGVTVGCGFDLGQLAEGEKGIATLKEYGFPESYIQKLMPYLGKKRLAADALLKNRPLVLNQDEINTINRLVMTKQAKDCIRTWDSHVEKLRRTHPNAPFFNELTSTQQTIVFSRHYHQGQGWYQLPGNQPAYSAMIDNDWNTVKNCWQRLVNYYIDKRIQWKSNRFQQEMVFMQNFK